jgi:hypothetical protein
MNISSTILFAVMVGFASGQRPQLLRVSRISDVLTTADNAAFEMEHLQLSSSFFDQKLKS